MRIKFLNFEIEVAHCPLRGFCVIYRNYKLGKGAAFIVSTEWQKRQAKITYEIP